MGGQADMSLDPATRAAAVLAYRGSCTVRAPWPKVKVVLHVPMYLHGLGSQPRTWDRVRGGAQIMPLHWYLGPASVT